MKTEDEPPFHVLKFTTHTQLDSMEPDVGFASSLTRASKKHRTVSEAM